MTSDEKAQGFGTVRVAGLPIADQAEDGLVAALVDIARDPGGDAQAAFALHIGGLLELDDAEYVAAMTASRINYADGMSAVLLARAAGARRIERAVTTDVGWRLLRSFGVAAGRPCRFAVVGGEPGLSARAAEELSVATAATAVYSAHGYHQDWEEVLSALRSARPDVVFVGLGAPREMKWVHRRIDELPPALIVTCGGWFGYVVGQERRAPSCLQRFGLEWTYRVWQQPRRLAGRYARGGLHFPRLIAATLWERIRDSRSSRLPGRA